MTLRDGIEENNFCSVWYQRVAVIGKRVFVRIGDWNPRCYHGCNINTGIVTSNLYDMQLANLYEGFALPILSAYPPTLPCTPQPLVEAWHP